jgi:hypothetical protein
VDEVDEGIVENQIAGSLIMEIGDMTGREEMFKPKVHVLGEEVVHHIDEEDCGLLADARKAWEHGKVDLVLIGAQMRERRRALYDVVASIGRDTSKIEVVALDADELEDLPAP